MLYCASCGSEAYGGRHVPTGRIAYSCKQTSYYKLHCGGYVNEDKILEHRLPWLEKLTDEINALATPKPHTFKSPTRHPQYGERSSSSTAAAMP